MGLFMRKIKAAIWVLICWTSASLAQTLTIDALLNTESKAMADKQASVKQTAPKSIVLVSVYGVGDRLFADIKVNEQIFSRLRSGSSFDRYILADIKGRCATLGAKKSSSKTTEENLYLSDGERVVKSSNHASSYKVCWAVPAQEQSNPTQVAPFASYPAGTPFNPLLNQGPLPASMSAQGGGELLKPSLTSVNGAFGDGSKAQTAK